MWRSIDRFRSFRFTSVLKLQLEPMDLNSKIKLTFYYCNWERQTYVTCRPPWTVSKNKKSVEVPADRMPGRRVPAWRQYSAKYAGARPVRHLYTSVASL